VDITGRTRLADITAMFPIVRNILREHGLDPDLLADTALADAADDLGVSVPALIAEIRRATRRERGPGRLPADLEAVTLEEIADVIVDSYHPALDRALGAAGDLMVGVLLVSGDEHDELFQVGREFDRLRRLVRNHLSETRGIVFPQLLGTTADDSPDSAVQSLESAHRSMGSALRRLRHAALGFHVPEEADEDWSALYKSLRDLETDTQRLIHLEEARLIPAARERHSHP
jgi:iron-sulfur cluster repair di-iron protein